MRTRRQSPSTGFTLIEVLVVVAVIALLVAILLPALGRARAQAKMVSCQSNLRQLTMAFLMYTNDNKGRLPGSAGDDGADWLGRDNTNAPQTGRQPDDGTIFEKHMGRQRDAYFCPDDKREGWQPNEAPYSYTANLLLSGASGEKLAGAHHPTMNFDSDDHTVNMRAFDGVPLIIEEDEFQALVQVDDSAWCNRDCITNRHLRGSGNKGRGNIGYHDGHVKRVILPPPPPTNTLTFDFDAYFHARSMCIRTAGGKWVSGRSFNDDTEYDPFYGFMARAPEAASLGVIHAN